ncbi:sulfatase family protein [Rufibacter quisquiliarum]|uniref:Arylsulfatase A-like enzyme n=1 Tax=Rufibacter quisquiliarum TaxID=1549639 RepID=A0A839GLD9_9BACT|nr:arylsulfatase [Rufibacter quisquiliarum]MBA9078633.1 arylsulfatase A-like enzyme [Rufibacter quisquiliarum]
MKHFYSVSALHALRLVAGVLFLFGTTSAAQAQQKPNIILIYTDDLGYGDISCNGATQVKTPNIDKLAAQGLRFTQAYATSATCTPSRFSMLTGKYAWRKQDTGIAPGDAALIIPQDMRTLPDMLQSAGYKTGVVGKWHLGLGPKGGPDWNTDVKPGPLEIGFNYSFLMPATADRVPCVYLENYRIVDLDPADPIQVSYKDKIGNDPTGKENPELLKMKYSHGHDNTIVNGVSRIGYMTGGNKARWIDEDMADVFTNRAVKFIDQNQKQPFFLYFATHDIHVPRLPHSRFAGKSGMGPRGDAILQLDWTVGEIMNALDRLNLAKNTILIFTSDNGPVVDDGYVDQAVEKLGKHTPSGPMRGGKYSAFEAGTRVPFLVRWPSKISPGVSNSLFSQVDLYASFASLTGQKLATQDAPDSHNQLQTLLGKAKIGREYVVQQSLNNTLSIVRGDWKYIEPSSGPTMNKNTNTELGNNPQPQLYHLKKDVAEKQNVAQANPATLKELQTLLASVKAKEKTRP